MLKHYYYADIDGQHFPDTIVGSELYYSLDFTCWLTNENDAIVSVEWEVGPSLELIESFKQGNVLHTKIRTTEVGTYSITCSVLSSENGNEQLKKVPMLLKVN